MANKLDIVHPISNQVVAINPAIQLPQRLSEINYPSWRVQFQSLLSGYHLEGYIDGSLPCPSPTLTNPDDDSVTPNPAYHLWKMQDGLLFNAILQSSSYNIFPLLGPARSAAEAWSRLEGFYSRKSPNRVMGLQNMLANTTKKNWPVGYYMQVVKQISETLALAGSPMSDKELILATLKGLGPEFKNITEAIYARESLITFEELYGELADHELFLKYKPTQSMTPNTAQCDQRETKIPRGKEKSVAQSSVSLSHAEPSATQRDHTKGSFLVEKCSVHKVHSGLRDVSAKHYEPVLVSIGAYHHGKTPLQDMQKHKVHYSQVLLDRANREKSSNIEHNNIVEAMKNEAALAVKCYPQQDIPSNLIDWVSLKECMLLDGCFMIELLRRNRHLGKQCLEEKRHKECKLNDEYLKDIRKDVLFNMKWMKPCLARDMLLFENQIPLFVLRKVFALTEQISPAHVDYEFVNLCLGFFEFRGKPVPYDRILIHQLDNTPHLLGLVYNALVPETHPQQPDQDECKSSSCESIKSAMSLKKAGVKFFKARDSEEFYRIVFINGVMSIPRLVINDNTETIFRNLIAYEQYTKHYSLHQVRDYLIVMDCLINSDKDVELLRHEGLIDNKIGDDVKVSTMFNNLCSNVYFDENNFFYAQMFDEVNKFCQKRWNKWMANIASNASKYFSGPWSLCSFLAALTLLVLTATQTVYSVFSYYQHQS